MNFKSTDLLRRISKLAAAPMSPVPPEAFGPADLLAAPMGPVAPVAPPVDQPTGASPSPVIPAALPDIRRPQASPELLALLNKAIGLELQSVIQYMWQSILWKGCKEFPIKDTFKSIAIAEMKHADMVAERVYYLGGIPTNEPNPRQLGETLAEKIHNDILAEQGAIDTYKAVVQVAEAQGDTTTAFLAKQILQDEEDHHDTFTTLYEECQ